MRVSCACGRNTWHDAFRLAVGRLLSVRVICIRNDIEYFFFEHGLCRISHRLQAAVIGCIQHNIMRDDDCVLSINGALQVICRLGISAHHHEARFRLWMLLQLFQSGLYASAIELWRLLTIQLFHAFEIFLQLEALARGVDTCYGTELASIDCNPLAADQSAAFREANKFRSSSSHCLSVHTPELGDGFVVRI